MRLSVETLLRHLAWLGPLSILIGTFLLRLLRQFIQGKTDTLLPPGKTDTPEAFSGPGMGDPPVSPDYLQDVISQVQQARKGRAEAPTRLNQHIASL